MSNTHAGGASVQYLLRELTRVSTGARNPLAASAICRELATIFSSNPQNAQHCASLERTAAIFSNLYSARNKYDRRPWWSRLVSNTETECAKILARDMQEAAHIIELSRNG